MDSKDKKSWQNWSSSQNGISDGVLKRLWDASENYKQGYQPDVEAGLHTLKQRMAQESGGAQVVPMRPKRSYLLRIAAGLAILAVGVLVFKNQLASSDGLQAIHAPTDSTLEKTLADGSQIELNTSSVLSFDDEFAQQERRVKLEGEAFFDVKRDETKPFIIEAAEAKITVLGTSFNVRAYPNEAVIEVYVTEGSVSVEIAGAGKPMQLSKGDQLKFDKKASKIELLVDDAGIPAAWHSGVLSFKGKPIPVVLKGMERLYGVNFDLKTNQPSDCLQTLTVQEGELEEAIQALRLSCPNMRFEKAADNNYSVTGACCQ